MVIIEMARPSTSPVFARVMRSSECLEQSVARISAQADPERLRRGSNAMTEIAAGKLSLAEIALNARFSPQASFTRAFLRATGVTRGEY